MQDALHQYAAQARPGQFLRFASNGRYLETVDRLTNGLGLIYQVRADHTVKRCFF